VASLNVDVLSNLQSTSYRARSGSGLDDYHLSARFAEAQRDRDSARDRARDSAYRQDDSDENRLPRRKPTVPHLPGEPVTLRAPPLLPVLLLSRPASDPSSSALSLLRPLPEAHDHYPAYDGLNRRVGRSDDSYEDGIDRVHKYYRSKTYYGRPPTPPSASTVPWSSEHIFHSQTNRITMSSTTTSFAYLTSHRRESTGGPGAPDQFDSQLPSASERLVTSPAIVLRPVSPFSPSTDCPYPSPSCPPPLHHGVVDDWAHSISKIHPTSRTTAAENWPTSNGDSEEMPRDSSPVVDALTMTLDSLKDPYPGEKPDYSLPTLVKLAILGSP
jgi:hypothetical protein